MFYGPSDNFFGLFGWSGGKVDFHLFPRVSLWGFKKIIEPDFIANEFNFGPLFSIDWFSSK